MSVLKEKKEWEAPSFGKVKHSLAILYLKDWAKKNGVEDISTLSESKKCKIVREYSQKNGKLPHIV